MEDYKLYDRDDVVGSGTEEQMHSMVKHHCPDGLYMLADPGKWFALVLYREDGIVYPLANLPCMGHVPVDNAWHLADPNWEQWFADAKENLGTQIAEPQEQN